MNETLPEYVDGFPNLCGSEKRIAEASASGSPAILADSRIDFSRMRSGFAVALHMHQPLIPAGGPDLQTAAIVSNLRFMLEHPEMPDAHNAAVFLACYKRMSEFIPRLLREGQEPRVMLDYSGCLLHGLRQMGADDVIEALKPLATDPSLRRCVEWLGTAWGHAVAPSTPARDFRLHVQAWRHHFAAVFGLEALSRVRGFSPPEMALPNHPDACYEFVKTLKANGFQWVMVQEQTVEQEEDCARPQRPHLPHRLVARNSLGQSESIVAIIKTGSSDTKLVGQMEPASRARGLSPTMLGGRLVPQLVSQIGDGENGGVMMNEFPAAFFQATERATGTDAPAMNVTEYLEHLAAIGIKEADFPVVRPLFHRKIWDRFEDGAGPHRLEEAIEQLRKEDNRFHVEGGSWTGHISWVRGYEQVLGPMQAASELFDQKVTRANVPTSEPRYRKALFHLLNSQTSCFRYWGQGQWTDFGRELCRRTVDILKREF